MSYFRFILCAFFACVLAMSSINVQAESVIEKTTTTTTTTAPADAAAPAPAPAPAPTTTPLPSPGDVKGRVIIVTPAPSAKEVIATPEGYVSCFNVEAGWNKNVWVPEHKVCRYENAEGQAVTHEGVAWVDGYWACTQYTATTCTKWEWKSGHWVKTLEVY